MRFMESRSLAKKLVEEKKIRLEGLAFKAECSFTTVTNWLAGKTIRPETEKTLRRILDQALSENTKATG